MVMARRGTLCVDDLCSRYTVRNKVNKLPEGQTDAANTPVWVERLVRFLDDGWRLPGTSFRVGADALLGLLIPGVGDAAAASASAGVFWLAVQRRVPKVVLARMAFNVALDALVGSVPLLGDAFDLVWKANRQNLQLVERYRAAPSQRARVSDYAIMALVLMLLASAVALPFLVAGAVVGYVWTR
jgi:hypothetical protein